jgi:FAD/FMN-containing dehydrogenase
MSAVGADLRLDEAKVRKLRSAFTGELLLPADARYDEHRRVWNGSIDRFPAIIARCGGVSDVVAAVRYARDAGLRVAVRGGGHSFPGFSTCDGGIVIDLSPMRAIAVDAVARTVRAQAGALLGDVDRATQAFGLAVPAGIVSHTGLAGLTLGGGIGWLMRKHGLTIDVLRRVELVTADARVITASPVENPDLFWAVRGGGGNFGIATAFEFALNAIGPIVLAGPIYWPIDRSADVLRFYRDWIADAPDELTTIVVHRTVQALASIPREMHGRRVVMVNSCYAGPIDDGEKVLRPLRAFGAPLLDLCAPKPFVAHQSMLDTSFPAGWWYYVRSANLERLSDDVIDIIAARAQEMTSPVTTFPIFQLGGAIRRVAAMETAFGGRDAGHVININAITPTADGFAAERDWSQRFWSALRPHQMSAYTNFLMEEGEERVREAHGAERYARLRALKRRYDPDNLFRLNQNIPPD